LFAGDITLDITGSRYEDGITRDDNSLKIIVSDATPSTLYYYCDIHPDMAGEDGDEAVITVNPNNPRVFGSGLEFTVLNIDSTNVIEFDVDDGIINSLVLNSDEATLGALTVTGESVLDNTSISSLTTADINTTSNLVLTSPTVKLSDNFDVGGSLTIDGSTGELETLGFLKTSDKLNVDDTTFIESNVISTKAGVNLELKPASGQVVSVDAVSALQIPSGNTNERPLTPSGTGDGYIRFNTQTSQYEGYSDTNGSWSSLGGVRDLDGNTTILAEESVGVNDNTLWFINDNINTVRFTPQYQEFVNVKKIRSVNVSAPSYTNWLANTPVSLGQYLKYRNNIYEVTVAGTTATPGNEPSHTSGTTTNGTAELTWFTTAAAPLTFDEISELRIDPLGFTDLVVNGELRFSTNTISSTNNDIIIEPTGSQKVKVKSTSSLVVPVGDANSKGNPERGSIRYNTTDNQFEGFNGAQWGGLGGVKDIDQDTKIEAETAPGTDEDILYFFNAGNNTLRLTTTQLEFDSIDTIKSSGTNILNIDASTVTFDSLATTIDNTNSTVTFITTSKDNLDFGLSTGLNNDHLLRLKDTGEIVFNLGFGTGTTDNLTLLNSNLTNFELNKVRVSTSDIPLIRGTLGSGNSTIYSIATESSAKVCLTAHNTTTGDKELVEYYVLDNGTDVYVTEYGNVKTGAELVSTVFDIDPLNNVRITFTLSSGLTVGDNVTVTLIKTVTKR
jgi:ribosomal protein L30E